MGSDDKKIGCMRRVNSKAILCIVPLPPPITGAAAASETLVNHLKKQHDVVTVAYQRGNLKSGNFSLRHFLKIAAIGMRLKLMRKHFDTVYLVISSTFWGNLRDLFFLILIGNRLRKAAVLHLHGANIDRYFAEAALWIRYLNRGLFGGVKNAIVLGKTFEKIFDGYVPRNKIRIVKNYFDDWLLIPEEIVSTKFESPQEVNILFLGNLIREKGYEVLLDAFLSLSDKIRDRAKLHFAGEIYSMNEKRKFMERIKNYTNVFYYGPVYGEKKRELLWKCHVFCLPSFYRFEGQPISILEAYACGCIVVSANNGGITDILINGANGMLVGKDLKINVDLDSMRGELCRALETIIINLEQYKDIAFFNLKEARQKYRRKIFCENIEAIVTSDGIQKVF